MYIVITIIIMLKMIIEPSTVPKEFHVESAIHSHLTKRLKTESSFS